MRSEIEAMRCELESVQIELGNAHETIEELDEENTLRKLNINLLMKNREKEGNLLFIHYFLDLLQLSFMCILSISLVKKYNLLRGSKRDF